MCRHSQHTCTHMCTSIYTAPTPQHVLLRNMNVQFMITSYYSLFSGLNEFDDGETSNKPYHDFYKLHKEHWAMDYITKALFISSPVF